MSLRTLVVDVGAKLGRSTHDVEPFVQALMQNWYDTVESLMEALPDDIASLGVPRRFAVELVNAAGVSSGSVAGREGRAKGKAKGKSPNEERSSGKGKGKNWLEEHKNSKGKGKKGKNSEKGSGSDHSSTIPIDLRGMAFTIPDFVFRPKLLGKAGTNVFHIQDASGAKVELKGRDEDDYLEFVITGNSFASVKRGTDMCKDLIKTVFDEYRGKGGIKGRGKSTGKSKESSKGNEGKAKSKGKGKEGKGKSKAHFHEGAEFKETLPVDTEGVDPSYYLRARLVGQDGQNVKHVERSTGARISVDHDDGQGMAFIISGNEKSAVDQAMDMCQDLMDTIVAEARMTSQAGEAVENCHEEEEVEEEPARKVARYN